MAHRLILGVGQNVVDMLQDRPWLVDARFFDQELLDKAISMGFNVEEFEKNNYPYAMVEVMTQEQRDTFISNNHASEHKPSNWSERKTLFLTLAILTGMVVITILTKP